MQSIKSIDVSVLPEWARQEVYDFFLFMKQRIEHQRELLNASECALLSEDSLAEDWNKSEEDEAWKTVQ
ncbi:MAG: hypothetical protein OXF97_02835 [Nitrospira sp.]|nr:hypothetical protein [Nitrospira sp.]